MSDLTILSGPYHILTASSYLPLNNEDDEDDSLGLKNEAAYCEYCRHGTHSKDGSELLSRVAKALDISTSLAANLRVNEARLLRGAVSVILV